MNIKVSSSINRKNLLLATLITPFIAANAYAETLRNRTLLPEVWAPNLIWDGGNNPHFNQWQPVGSADPTAKVFDGKLYVYTSTDSKDLCQLRSDKLQKHSYSPWANTGFCMPGYQVFSSVDTALNQNTWQKHGLVLRQKDVPWARKSAEGWGNSATMWAADVVQGDDGKFYMFFPSVRQDNNHQTIGVAVADTPAGPFVARANPISTSNNFDHVFDPSVIKIGTQWYMFYAKNGSGGNKAIWAAKIDANFNYIYSPMDLMLEPGSYLEGPHAYKVGEDVWLQWASVTAPADWPYPGGYQIKQAVAWNNSNPMHNFDQRGILVHPFGNAGTNHGSVVEWANNYWAFYHDHLNGKSDGYNPTAPDQVHNYRRAMYSLVDIDVTKRGQINAFRPDNIVSQPSLSN
ncbi:family 43 glycosylhydrolase [Vibrio methylphosphonaticus]|uniref:family 43 glycosylhydrolase n=1 Tax=Vibrio methylphosphonaticus TaxID=2946866 RepID=UPI00202A90D1|nr:family 43 glycosylhydrolase [Vibrio methylphosphonaticus]MCL9777235.1 family 43 glycosylhydrolase [Vibrio methylphosphonaticus]